MNWKSLDHIQTLDEIDHLSAQQPVVIFKHSTQCGISARAIGRIENSYDLAGDQGFVWYYLDLLQHRDVSNAVAERYGIEHESPQVLVIRHGKCVYTASHYDIQFGEVTSH